MFNPLYIDTAKLIAADFKKANEIFNFKDLSSNTFWIHNSF